MPNPILPFTPPIQKPGGSPTPYPVPIIPGPPTINPPGPIPTPSKSPPKKAIEPRPNPQPLEPVGRARDFGPLVPPGSPQIPIQTAPGQSTNFDGFGPIGNKYLDRLGDILTRHLSLFDGFDLKDFFTFVPPHSGIQWMEPPNSPRALGTREGQAALGVALRETRKANIVEANSAALNILKTQSQVTPKVEGITLLTSSEASPNRPDGSKSAFHVSYDRRQRGRLGMLGTIPPEMAVVLADQPDTPEQPTVNVSADTPTNDVGLNQLKSPSVTSNFYANNTKFKGEANLTATVPNQLVTAGQNVSQPTQTQNVGAIIGTVAVAVIAFMILRKI